MGVCWGKWLLFLASTVGEAEKVKELASWQAFFKVFRGWEPQCEQEGLGHVRGGPGVGITTKVTHVGLESPPSGAAQPPAVSPTVAWGPTPNSQAEPRDLRSALTPGPGGRAGAASHVSWPPLARKERLGSPYCVGMGTPQRQTRAWALDPPLSSLTRFLDSKINPYFLVL